MSLLQNSLTCCVDAAPVDAFARFDLHRGLREVTDSCFSPFLRLKAIEKAKTVNQRLGALRIQS
jgi:hypothetical protein